jgi:hypothetical protein
MDSGGFQKRTDRLLAHHGWRSKPGYKIFVANRGDVRFDIPSKWVIAMPGRECDVELRDRKAPHDDCIIQLSVWHHPPEIEGPVYRSRRWPARVAAGRRPAGVRCSASSRRRSRTTRTRTRSGGASRTTRSGRVPSWSGASRRSWTGSSGARRARQCMARGPQSHAIITMSYWPERERRFRPVWDELVRTLTLGVYIRDPLLGE